MLNSFFKYFVSFFFLIIFSVLLLDYIILPSYVGYNNEHYLPDLRGDYLEKAQYNLQELGFKVSAVYAPYSNLYDPGTIIKMSPRAFTKVKEGRTINLTVASKISNIEMPTLIDKSIRNAELILAKLNLNIDTVIYEYDNDVVEGFITFQVPRNGKILKSQSQITIGVSKGVAPDFYLVPDIINLSLNAAQKIILDSGLRIGNISYEYQPELLKNTVISQSMTSGMRVSFPASINLIVSKDYE